MKANLVVLLDACVLIPMPLADTLLRLAAGPQLYLPKWTNRIMNEVSRNLQENFGLSAERAIYREREIRRHFPAAWVEGYENLIPAMTNSPKDRHVLAAAVHSDADVILTYNAKDFPQTSISPYSITIQGPSTFLIMLDEMDPSGMRQCLEEQAAAIGKPVYYVLERLKINAPRSIDTLKFK